MEAGALIVNNDLNIIAQYWLGFINCLIMPLQNKSILCHRMTAYPGFIIYRKTLNFGLIKEQKITMRAKQHQTSFSFSILIIQLRRRAGVPPDEKRDI